VLSTGIVRESENDPTVALIITGPKTCPELFTFPLAGRGGFAVGQRMSGMGKVTSVKVRFGSLVKLVS